MELSEDLKALLNEKRANLEAHVLTTFDGKEMWYQEKRLQFKGIANITTDEWGVSIRFECENSRERKWIPWYSFDLCFPNEWYSE